MLGDRDIHSGTVSYKVITIGSGGDILRSRRREGRILFAAYAKQHLRVRGIPQSVVAEVPQPALIAALVLDDSGVRLADRLVLPLGRVGGLMVFGLDAQVVGDVEVPPHAIAVELMPCIVRKVRDKQSANLQVQDTRSRVLGLRLRARREGADGQYREGKR